MVYSSSSISLAVLETLVHADSAELSRIRFVLFSIDIPSSVKIDRIDRKSLPPGWTAKSPIPAVTQEIGDNWVREGKTAVLAVPSVVTPQEFNYLLNPAHKDMARIVRSSPEPFRIDERFFS
jgi:RES domain-containing protein